MLGTVCYNQKIMDIIKTAGWEEYELIDSGEGKRLERFGKYLIVRSDPQVIWKKNLSDKEWDKATAIFEKGKSGREGWTKHENMPEKWVMNWGNISFYAKLTPFKHTGVFPEQVLQWEWMREKILSSHRPTTILNLFAYTGIASLVVASVGSKVTHVDASKPTITWARHNQHLSNLSEKPIRWIVDDAIKFTQREVKRGVKYDGIIMDPPVYGHGPNGELWNFPISFPKLIDICQQLLSDKPLFMIVNVYAISSSALMLTNMLVPLQKSKGGIIKTGELALEEKKSQRLLSTGIFARWYK